VPVDKVHARQWGLRRSARMHWLSVGPMWSCRHCCKPQRSAAGQDSAVPWSLSWGICPVGGLAAAGSSNLLSCTRVAHKEGCDCPYWLHSIDVAHMHLLVRRPSSLRLLLFAQFFMLWQPAATLQPAGLHFHAVLLPLSCKAMLSHCEQEGRTRMRPRCGTLCALCEP
jgi:hypothetical protein